MKRHLVLGLAAIGLIECVLLSMTDLQAASSTYPCKATYGAESICGPNGDAPPGSCFHAVGSTTCTSTATVHCSDVNDYWCHKDDECGTTTKSGSSCATSNYTTDTFLWYFDCPSRAGLPPSPCTCVRETDFETTKPITYKAFDAGGTRC